MRLQKEVAIKCDLSRILMGLRVFPAVCQPNDVTVNAVLRRLLEACSVAVCLRQLSIQLRYVCLMGCRVPSKFDSPRQSFLGRISGGMGAPRVLPTPPALSDHSASAGPNHPHPPSLSGSCVENRSTAHSSTLLLGRIRDSARCTEDNRRKD